MARRIEVCPVTDLPPGEKTIVSVDGLPHSVGVFNVNGSFYALANLCPHHLAPLCEGTITGEMVAENVGEYNLIRDGEIIQCPWHGWKFDIRDGSSVFNPHALQTRTYDVAVETTESTEEQSASDEPYGTPLLGEEPPVDTYEVDVEEDVVVLYV